MKFHIDQFFRAVLLAAFALLFIHLHISEEIYKYINPKYELLSQIAAVLFVFFFFIQLFRIWEKKSVHEHHCHCCTHDHGQTSTFPKIIVHYSIIIFPLFTGFSLAPAVLDASIAEKKGMNLKGVALDDATEKANTNNKTDANTTDERKGETEQEMLQEPTPDTNSPELYVDDQIALPNNNYLTQEQYDEKVALLDQTDTIVMDEDIFEPYYEKIGMSPQAYEGKKIQVAGFIYREEGFTPQQLVVSRFLITHCVADASIIGFLTQFDEDMTDLPHDAWLEVSGTLTVGTYKNIELPVIQAEKWKMINQPEEPYIFPVLTKIVE